jgi:hypothetical protein
MSAWRGIAVGLGATPPRITLGKRRCASVRRCLTGSAGREPRPLETAPDRIRRESDELKGIK